MSGTVSHAATVSIDDAHVLVIAASAEERSCRRMIHRPRNGSTSDTMCTWLLALTASLSWLSSAGAAELDLGSDVRVQLIEVQAGQATLGSPVGEAGHGNDEIQRTITITRPFLIGVTPVTRGQFARFTSEGYRTEAESGPSGGWGLVNGALAQRKEFTWRQPGFPQDDTHPVVLVTWNDAQAFCAWASLRTGWTVTLPSEAEWELACRGGPDGTWNGPATLAVGGTRPVGGDPANPLGLHDLLGHVNQWCADWYTLLPPEQPSDPFQQQPPTGESARRSLRGGSFLQIQRTRPAARWRNSPATRNADNGFRIIARPGKSALANPEAQSSSHTGATDPAAAGSSFPAGYSPPVIFDWIFTAVLVVGGAIVLFFVIFFVAAMRAARGNSGSAPKMATRLKEDGFWVDTVGMNRSKRLRYRVMRDGRWQNAEADIVPGRNGQFIYTGYQPDQVQLLGLADAGAAARAAMMSTDSPATSDSHSRSSFPSAY